MGHAIARSVPPVSRDGAGPLHLDDTSHREWDIVMTRDGRWVACATGITDPADLRQQLDWFRLGNRSVTFHVIERVITLLERLLDEAPEEVRGDVPGDAPEGGFGGLDTASVLSSPGRSTATTGHTAIPAAIPAANRASNRDARTAPSVEHVTATATARPSSTPAITTVRVDELSVRCPACRVPAGTPCRTPSGKPVARHHAAREELAGRTHDADVAEARQRGVSLEELRAQRAPRRDQRVRAASERRDAQGAAPTRQTGKHEARPTDAARADQSWFQGPSWQAGEAEVDEHLRRGQVTTSDSVQEFLAGLEVPHVDDLDR